EIIFRAHAVRERGLLCHRVARGKIPSEFWYLHRQFSFCTINQSDIIYKCKIMLSLSHRRQSAHTRLSSRKCFCAKALWLDSTFADSALPIPPSFPSVFLSQAEQSIPQAGCFVFSRRRHRGNRSVPPLAHWERGLVRFKSDCQRRRFFALPSPVGRGAWGEG